MASAGYLFFFLSDLGPLSPTTTPPAVGAMSATLTRRRNQHKPQPYATPISIAPDTYSTSSDDLHELLPSLFSTHHELRRFTTIHVICKTSHTICLILEIPFLALHTTNTLLSHSTIDAIWRGPMPEQGIDNIRQYAHIISIRSPFAQKASFAILASNGSALKSRTETVQGYTEIHGK